jgi:hypothetical protein
MKRAVVLFFVFLVACGSVSQEIQGPMTPDTILPFAKVVSYQVIVPRSLTVSESDAYYPMADIVWRGDPPGDRYDQVAQIFRDSLRWGMSAFNRGRPVKLLIEVKKFHALSQRARYTVGGVHTIRFFMTVTDARTGAVIIPREKFSADLRALGGENAVQAELIGRGQRVRIVQHLAGTLQRILVAKGLGQLKLAPGQSS